MRSCSGPSSFFRSSYMLFGRERAIQPPGWRWVKALLKTGIKNSRVQSSYSGVLRYISKSSNGGLVKTRSYVNLEQSTSSAGLQINVTSVLV
eukprot:36562-Eustigmatos_ZCMA.PRE.1